MRHSYSRTSITLTNRYAAPAANPPTSMGLVAPWKQPRDAQVPVLPLYLSASCLSVISDAHRSLASGLRDRPGPQIRLAVLEFPSFWQVILARKIEYLHDNEGKSSSELLCSTEAPIRGLKASRARTGSQVQSEGEGVLVLFIALRTTVQLDRN